MKCFSEATYLGTMEGTVSMDTTGRKALWQWRLVKPYQKCLLRLYHTVRNSFDGSPCRYARRARLLTFFTLKKASKMKNMVSHLKLWAATPNAEIAMEFCDSVEKPLHAASSDRLNFSPHSFVTLILNSSLLE